MCQMSIRNAKDAISAFDLRDDNGGVPVVLVPKDWGFPFRLFVKIPSGVYVMFQSWHKHVGLKSAGLIWFWGGWNRVSHIVTKSTITYSSPVRSVPTSDNVMVDIDLSLTFQIGPDEDAAYRFVYHLGAHRLDDMLTAQTDEAIRGLVYSVPYRKVHDLREAFAQGTMRALNKVLIDYGVSIKSVKVTDVRLPRELSETLENTTSFKTKMLEQEKKHENDMRVLENNEKQKMTGIQKQNEREHQDLRAKLDRLMIDREQNRAVTTSNLSVSITDAESRTNVAIAHAESNKSVAEVQGKRAMEELLGSSRVNNAAKLVSIEQDAKSRILVSEAKLEAVKAQAKAMLTGSKVEGEYANAYKELRTFEYEKERLKTMSTLAKKGQYVISGDAGEAVLKNVCPGTPLDLSMKQNRGEVKPVS